MSEADALLSVLEEIRDQLVRAEARLDDSSATWLATAEALTTLSESFHSSKRRTNALLAAVFVLIVGVVVALIIGLTANSSASTVRTERTADAVYQAQLTAYEGAEAAFSSCDANNDVRTLIHQSFDAVFSIPSLHANPQIDGLVKSIQAQQNVLLVPRNCGKAPIRPYPPAR